MKKKIIASYFNFILIKLTNYLIKIIFFDIGARHGDFSNDYINSGIKVIRSDAFFNNRTSHKICFFSKNKMGKLYIYKNNASLYKIKNERLLQTKKIALKKINKFITLHSKGKYFAVGLDCEGANLDILKPLIKSKLKKKLLLIYSEVENKEIFLGAPLYEDFKSFMNKNNYKLLYEQKFSSSGQSNVIFCKRSMYIYFLFFIKVFSVINIFK